MAIDYASLGYTQLREEDKFRRSDFRFVSGFLDYTRRCSKNEDTKKLASVLVMYNCVIATGIATIAVIGAFGLEKLVK